jgi:hypothetical protein
MRLGGTARWALGTTALVTAVVAVAWQWGSSAPPDAGELQALRHVQLGHQQPGDRLGTLEGPSAPGLPDDSWAVSCEEPDRQGQRWCDVLWTQRHRSYADGDETYCLRTTMTLVPETGGTWRVNVPTVQSRSTPGDCP